MTDKQWDGRFAEPTDRLVEAFTESIRFDRRLYPYDIAGSIAHCRMLAKTGIITAPEAEQLIQGLEAIKTELDQGVFLFDAGLEDIHMHIETRLTERLGAVAQKLHTARSRNDQVALDLRMFLKDKTGDIIERLHDLRQVLVTTAESHIDIVLPGYTHLQRAQPVLLAHHLMAYYEMFTRDADRFGEARRRMDSMPLGTAALAGTAYPIDRHYTAELLGFGQVSANSIDSVADRDFLLEFLSAAAIAMVHLSRMAEELILWSTAEFRFVELPDAFATGSSIMPQKKNPDVPELVRGKTGRVVGALMSMLTTMKSLPLAYNRDMQEDKEPLFDAADTLEASLTIFARLLPKLTFNAAVMRQATGQGFLNATDLADYLVAKGMPFRQAHHCVGQAVAYALGHDKELHELSLEELQPFSDLIESDVFEHLSVEHMIDRRGSFGGTATEMVKSAIAAAKETLGS